MTITVAFDVYGTLIDPFDVSASLSDHVGGQASRFAQIWRDKQIEYLFRRALMRDYRNFSTCTRQALEYTNSHFRSSLSEEVKAALMEQYRVLPAYPGVPDALEKLKNRGCRMFAFSNGQPDDLEHLLNHAGIIGHLDGVVSVHDVRSYKPDPAVYQYFLENTDADATRTWLVSGNSFDVVGAMRVGWNAAWLRRDPAAVFDPWDVEPTAIISDLSELSGVL